MTSFEDPRTRCLDVAIDHRIMRLCRPVPQPTQGRYVGTGNHVDILEREGLNLGRTSADIEVTCDLARPTSTGGIVVTLQQPRHNHPLNMGDMAVVGECETLWTLRQLFDTVSCNTLDLKDHITVVDLLPYTPSTDLKGLNNEDLIHRLRSPVSACVEALCSKRPDVVLCAGRMQMPTHLDDQTCRAIKGDAFKIETRGVGLTFDDIPRIWLNGDSGIRTMTPRVNSIHPSYAMNYNIEHSCLRQLLLFSVAQTCGVLRQDWDEQAWMGLLRKQCREVSQQLSRRDRERGKPYKGVQYYIDQYIAKIVAMMQSLQNMILSGEASYENILNSHLSELCNDTSLVLQKLSQIERDGRFVSDQKTHLAQLLSNTWESVLFPVVDVPIGHAYFSNSHAGVSVGQCLVIFRDFLNSRAQELDVEGAAAAFLSMAENLELVLGDLLGN